MATQVQFRRGTTAQNNSFTGVIGELSVNTSINALRIHDGSTSGGFELAKSNLSNISSVGVVTATTFVGSLTGTSGTITTLSSTNGTITNLTNTNLNVTGVVTFSSTQTYPRIPANTQGSAYTLVLSDAGKVVINSSGGVTVPSGVFTAGDVISIYNNSASDIALNQGGSVTMYKAGSATTGNQLIAQRGIAVVLCVASNNFVCSGVK